MHNGLQFALELGAQGDDVTPIALGDDGFLQNGLVGGIPNDAFEPGEQAVVRDFNLGADGGKFRRGVVEHLSAV